MPLVPDDSTVFSYELQIDNGRGGQYTSVGGYTTESMETEYTIGGLTAGLVYRIRYRTLNYVGWSSYSPILYALVANVPSAPAPVDLSSATSTSISLLFHESLDNGGAHITSYELWMDDGYGTAFTKVSGYTDNQMAHTISSGLVSGKIYTFKFRSENSIGFSEFSGLSRYAIALPPGKPTKPVKDMARSTQTSIYVTWSESAATQVPILGYKLYMSKGTSEYELVYHENNNPLIREFNATGLETGALYQFRVAAINFNGDSEWSDALHKYSCQLP